MRLTGRGVAMLGVAACCYAIGELAGFFVFRALAGVALAVVLVAVATTLVRPTVEISRTVHPDRIERGKPALATLAVRNTGTRGQSGFAAGDRIGTRVHRIQIRPLAPGAEATYHYELPTQTRGRLQVGPHVLHLLDPLELVRRQVRAGGVADLWVYPRRHAMRPAQEGHPRHHHDGPITDPPLRGSIDLRAVRQYVMGDEVRLLHWKATARTGQLMVREYADPAQPRLTVVLDTRAEAMPVPVFEEAIEVAASLLSASAMAGQHCRLITSTGTDLVAGTGPRAARAVLDHLCVSGQDAPARAPLVPMASATGRPGGALVVITGIRADVSAVLRWRPDTVIRLGVVGYPRAGAGVIVAPAAAEAVASWNAIMAGHA